MLIFQERKYSAGRPIVGYIRGTPIPNITSISPGDKIISVCSEFQAENLAIVIQTDDDKFYATWLQFAEGGERTLDSNGYRIRLPQEPILGPDVFCRWDFMFQNSEEIIYHAVKVPTHDLDEIDLFSSQEVESIIRTFGGEVDHRNSMQDMRYHAKHLLQMAMKPETPANSI